jgi:hypothetical protein
LSTVAGDAAGRTEARPDMPERSQLIDTIRIQYYRFPQKIWNGVFRSYDQDSSPGDLSPTSVAGFALIRRRPRRAMSGSATGLLTRRATAQ